MLEQMLTDTKDISSGKTALHHASEGGNIEVATFLIAAGASTEARDKEGKTPVDCAKNVEEILKAIKNSIPNDTMWVRKPHEYLSVVKRCLDEKRTDDDFIKFLGEGKEKFYYRKVAGWNI